LYAAFETQVTVQELEAEAALHAQAHAVASAGSLTVTVVPDPQSGPPPIGAMPAGHAHWAQFVSDEIAQLTVTVGRL
jgi:hypothetical protein